MVVPTLGGVKIAVDTIFECGNHIRTPHPRNRRLQLYKPDSMPVIRTSCVSNPYLWRVQQGKGLNNSRPTFLTYFL